MRGIGSLYYLMYAIQHGLPEPLALQLMQMTLIVVTLSILLHGISVKPLMEPVLAPWPLMWVKARRGRGGAGPRTGDVPTPQPACSPRP